MLETYYQLLTIAKRIGDNASLQVKIVGLEDLEDTIVFQVDWPDDCRVETQFPVARLLAEPEDVSEMVIQYAQQEHIKLRQAGAQDIEFACGTCLLALDTYLSFCPRCGKSQVFRRKEGLPKR